MKLTMIWGVVCACAMSSLAFAAGEHHQLAFAPIDDNRSSPPVREPDQPLVDSQASPRRLGNLDWHVDYATAYREAQAQRKMLFILFRDNRNPKIADSYERDVLSREELQPHLKNVTRVILPLDTQSPAADGEKPVRLLDHSSFGFMYQRQGIAVMDLTDAKSPWYGKVVSAHPFTSGLHYTVRSTSIVLGLPKGTVTQRALIYAVRMHPGAPQCASGQCNPFVLEQCHRSSQLMAQSGAVGHHDWGTRSAQVSAATGRMPMEVAASSFGSSMLIDAATEIVQNWQGSPTHWGMMIPPATIFGFDMVRSPNGAWFGTGIFAN